MSAGFYKCFNLSKVLIATYFRYRKIPAQSVSLPSFVAVEEKRKKGKDLTSLEISQTDTGKTPTDSAKFLREPHGVPMARKAVIGCFFKFMLLGDFQEQPAHLNVSVFPWAKKPAGIWIVTIFSLTDASLIFRETGKHEYLLPRRQKSKPVWSLKKIDSLYFCDVTKSESFAFLKTGNGDIAQASNRPFARTWRNYQFTNLSHLYSLSISIFYRLLASLSAQFSAKFPLFHSKCGIAIRKTWYQQH